jgi:ATP-dependent Clp protease ATP-binding subunit ClpC
MGASDLQRPSQMGFGISGSAADNYDAMRTQLEDRAKKNFKPEFLNRLDEIVVFRQLNRDDLAGIIILEIKKIQERLASREMLVEVTPAAVNLLLDRGYKPEYGARQLRRAVERFLEDPLAEQILRGNFKDKDKIIADSPSGEEISFTHALQDQPGSTDTTAGPAQKKKKAKAPAASATAPVKKKKRSPAKGK